MGLPAAHAAGEGATADVKCRRCIGVISSASALRPHVAYGERLLAVGDEAVIPRLIGWVVGMGRQLALHQCMGRLAAATSSRIATTHSK